jgi:DNA-binding transcriptional ArsR family regulator
MLRLRMSVDDIARTRLAAPGLCELPVSVQALQHVGHPYRGLWRSRAGAVPRQAGRLLELVPKRGDVPLFLAPEMVNDVDEAVDIVQSTPTARIRAEVMAGRAARPTPWVEDLCRGRREALHELGAAIRAYHHGVMAPLSPVHTRVVAAELSHRTRQMAEEGIAATLNSLHPAIRWGAGVLEVTGLVNADVDLSGRGLRVMPSVWPRPGVALHWRQPTLVYPIPYAVWSMNAGYDGAKAALGATRATVLQALVDEHTTSSLARAVALSPSSASAHASALRRAGLVASRRRGKTMVHSLTSLGLDVLTASTVEGALGPA